MYDVLPYPNITGNTLEEKLLQINNYLIQFKETLEFILGDIGIDNLSQEVIDRLNGLSTNESTAVASDEIQQIASKTLSVSDVVNSELFKSAVKGEISKIEFSVNYDTGYLEYTVKE